MKFFRIVKGSIGGLVSWFLLFSLFQDLQFEIDTERENFLSLTASGRKILKQMDDGSSGGNTNLQFYIILVMDQFYLPI